MKRQLLAGVSVTSILVVVIAAGLNDNAADRSARLEGAAKPASAPQVVKKGEPLAPTSTCPAADIAELERIRNFILAKTWTERRVGFSIGRDTTQCVVRLRIPAVTRPEEASLRKEGGAYLVIEYGPEPERLSD